MARLHRLDPGPDTVHWGYFDASLPPPYRPEHREIVTNLKPILGGQEFLE